MDPEAVWHCNEQHLIELGLKERGHIICLKTFCMPNEEGNQIQETKTFLAEAIKSTSIERTQPSKNEEV